ncbi:MULTISPECIES: hypothetical protein [Vagococcus]|nr:MULTISPECIES: hypothetical protein [Vagococcus]
MPRLNKDGGNDVLLQATGVIADFTSKMIKTKYKKRLWHDAWPFSFE